MPLQILRFMKSASIAIRMFSLAKQNVFVFSPVVIGFLVIAVALMIQSNGCMQSHLSIPLRFSITLQAIADR